MKKLFVSVPMAGRDETTIKNDIQKMKKIAEVYEGEELELIDTFISASAPADCNGGIWYLYKSLELLSKADVFIGIENDEQWRGCHIESETAKAYGLKCYKVKLDYIITEML